MLKTHSGIVGLRSGVTNMIFAKSADLTTYMVANLATYNTESSSFRNPLRFLAQSLQGI